MARIRWEAVVNQRVNFASGIYLTVVSLVLSLSLSLSLSVCVTLLQLILVERSYV